MSRVKNLWIMVLLVALIGYFAFLEIQFFHKPILRDFFHFYEASKALVSHQYLYSSGIGGYVYPPFFAFLMIPLTHFSLETAKIIWKFLNYLFLFFSLYLSFKLVARLFRLQYNKWQVTGVCCLTVLLCLNQVANELKFNQTDILILFGITLSLYYFDSKPLFSGIILGIIANIKYITFFFLPLLIFRARWRVVIGLLIGLIIGLILPAVIIGWKTNLHYLMIAFRGLKNMPGERAPLLVTQFEAKVPGVMWTHNISITNGLLRIMVDQGYLASYALFISINIAVVIFLILWRIFYKQSIPFIWRPLTLKNGFYENAVIYLELTALLVILLAFSPQCTLRHLLLVVNLQLLAVVMLIFPVQQVKRWPALTGILIYQLGTLFNRVFLVPFHMDWNYFGGPAWALVLALPFIIYNGLTYCQALYSIKFEKIN
ncbi:MAG: DUF2029 domain-containing protein [Proteobacteria bacterium]|nr:DUF2029 domain-containing protein [Pseudomonadota bacterium]